MTTTMDCHWHENSSFNSASNDHDDAATTNDAVVGIRSSSQLIISTMNSTMNNNCPSMPLSSISPSRILPPADRSRSRARDCGSTTSSSSSMYSNDSSRSSCSKRFITKMALTSTACSIILLFALTASFSEWTMQDIQLLVISDVMKSSSGEEASAEVGPMRQRRRQLFHVDSLDVEWDQQQQQNHVYQWKLHHRHLDQAENGNNNNNNEAANGDYSSYRCDEIFTNTPSSSSSSPSERCQYAQTCDEGSGLLLPVVFCRTSRLSTLTWMILLSPPLLLLLTLLFRLLGSTADDYFSPSLEMFSTQLGLPPRFAGVTLLALGNGASDVSATMNAIASDPEHGYKMSLGALTGGAMFVTTVVAGSVILAGGGVVCRGALVRDVAALGITVMVVAWNLEKGEVGPGTERLFISIYVAFVLIVLIADVYHRAVMLPRIRQEAQNREHERQLMAEMVASKRAGAALNAFAKADNGVGNSDAQGQGLDTGLCGVGIDDGVGDGTPSSTPSWNEDTTTSSKPAIKNRALNAVLAALSNYNDVADDFDADENASMEGSHFNGPTGWGVGSSFEGSRSWDRPIVLHGSDGLLSRHNARHHPKPDGHVEDEFQSAYHFMEDRDLLDRMCLREGSLGFPTHNWIGAWHDGRHELAAHFRVHWSDIVDDPDSNGFEKFLLVCEYPITIARKLTVSIPCEGSYCRALVALSFAVSPFWYGFYLLRCYGVNIWGWEVVLFGAVNFFIGLMVMRFAPGGEGTMATMFAVPIALYGFVVAATWIDLIADNLVSLLEFLGIMCRIPNAIMGMTILAWGNSMPDLSGNVTMARKGLSNMAITACFAGPVFNILIGLGAGFGVLRSATKTDVNYVNLTASIRSGFGFCFFNCGLLLVTGLAINKGFVPARHGYTTFVIYTLYVATSILLQFLS